MKLEGLVVNFLGDSITEGRGVENIRENRFDHVLMRLCGFKQVNNYGIGGTRIAHQIRPSAEARWDLNFCSRAAEMSRDADLIVVFGGTNDYGHGDAPFGQLGDSTRETFCGSVNFLMNILRETYPHSRLVFMTPAHRLGDAVQSVSPSRYTPGLPLKMYNDVIKMTAKKYDIPVMDMFELLGIDPNDEQQRMQYTEDGLHFNDAGHHVIAEKLKLFLESL